MEQVILLTETQKQEIEGRKFTTDSYFNPREDEDGNWIDLSSNKRNNQ